MLDDDANDCATGLNMIAASAPAPPPSATRRVTARDFVSGVCSCFESCHSRRSSTSPATSLSDIISLLLLLDASAPGLVISAAVASQRLRPWSPPAVPAGLAARARHDQSATLHASSERRERSWRRRRTAAVNTHVHPSPSTGEPASVRSARRPPPAPPPTSAYAAALLADAHPAAARYISARGDALRGVVPAQLVAELAHRSCRRRSRATRSRRSRRSRRSSRRRAQR